MLTQEGYIVPFTPTLWLCVKIVDQNLKTNKTKQTKIRYDKITLCNAGVYNMCKDNINLKSYSLITIDSAGNDFLSTQIPLS